MVAAGFPQVHVAAIDGDPSASRSVTAHPSDSDRALTASRHIRVIICDCAALPCDRPRVLARL